MTDLFLGVDGGGTKTAFVVVDESAAVIAEYTGGSSYHPQIGLNGLEDLLREGIERVCPDPARLRNAFFGLPAFGEDSRIDPVLAALPAKFLGHGRYSCGNDMVCGWAGSLGGEDGINIVAGTGSIAYGERGGRSARAGGWGELFSDEGSAYWIAIEGLRAYAKKVDGRIGRGPLVTVLKDHFALDSELDLCGRINAPGTNRDTIAALCPLVSQAASAGDPAASEIFARAGVELAAIVHAVGQQLGGDALAATRVSYSGGVFQAGSLVLEPLASRLATFEQGYELVEPLADGRLGAALYAIRTAQ